VPPTSIVETFSAFPLPEGLMAKATLGTRPNLIMPPKKAARFPRAARLLRHADFERVYRQGRRHFSASMTVFYWPRPEQALEMQVETRMSVPQGLRVGFTVGRALGSAVQRNRMKRRLREAVRMTRPTAGVAADVVINPKKSLLTTEFAALLNEVSRAFVTIEEKLSGKLPEKATSAGEIEKPNADRRS
jgi:ribonuclease P protein component